MDCRQFDVPSRLADSEGDREREDVDLAGHG
jgi:hypothetical protein